MSDLEFADQAALIILKEILSRNLSISDVDNLGQNIYYSVNNTLVEREKLKIKN